MGRTGDDETLGLDVRAAALADGLVELRRDIHRRPELGFEEERTSALVVRELKRAGVTEVLSGIARTGVIARIPAARQASSAVLLRADMDALPIQEVEGRSYGSEVPGKMHACGHDAHTAMLLGAARLIVERRHALTEDVVFCFQPAEEGAGGAAAMIDEGVLERFRVSRAFALHVWSPFPAGTLHVRDGPIMAAQDEFSVRIEGEGGHGALPHQARDPIVAAAAVVTTLQTLVARELDPLESAVVTVGALHAGDAPNVIPGEVRMIGTLRSFRPGVRAHLRDRVRAIAEATASAHRCRAEVEIAPGYPAVVNDPEAARVLRESGRRTLGADAVIEAQPLMAAEDFAYFLERVPGAFALLGAGNVERGIDAPHHSPRFDIDETVLPKGAALLARAALAGAHMQH